MCRALIVLALIALCVGLGHSWDYAVTRGDQLEFYTNGVKMHSEGVQFRDLTAIAYDAVYNMLLFVDKQSDDASIFSYNILSAEYQSLVKRKAYENIQGLAFDPVKGLLFWTDTNERSIYWISLKPGSKNNVYGNLLIKMDDEIPRAIAVDSCRGYIYWTNTNTNKPTIERARFNGSEREVVVDSNIYMPTSLAIDQHTKQIYWADDRQGIHYSIGSADLNGKNRRTLLVGIHHQPNALTVSSGYIYWVDWGYKSVWRLPKNPSVDAEPKEISNFKDETPFGIAANYKIKEQTEIISGCEALTSLLLNTGTTNLTYVPTKVGLFCVHGIKVSGDCSRNAEGHPKCRCNAGYSGERCEVYACQGYCLNNGECYLNEEDEPVCQCVGKYEGSRCEAVKNVASTNILASYLPKSNLNLAHLVSSWISPTVNISVTVEV